MADGVPTWEEVARDYGRFLYNVAYRLAGNDDDAQDLVQEALIRVRKGLERYEPGSLEGWLARIVTNVFLDEVRRRKRRPTDALPDDPGRVLPPTPAADEVPTGLSDEVQRALGGLPDDFRVPVVLCDVSDLSYEQIADATGVPIGTVRSRIHRGRRLLRAALVADGVSGTMNPDDLVPEMLSAYLDGELDPSGRAAVDARLAESAEWRLELADVRAARDAVRALPTRDAPEGFWDAVSARSRQPTTERPTMQHRSCRSPPPARAAGSHGSRRRSRPPRPWWS